MHVAGGWYVACYNYTDSRSDSNSNSNRKTLIYLIHARAFATGLLSDEMEAIAPTD
jgi:hypothetical protein